MLALGDADLLHPSVRDAMAALDFEYEIMPCDPALADTAAFVAAYGVPVERSVNTILVASKGADPTYATCLLLATTSLDVNNVVRREMGVRKASFAGADAVRAVTGMEIGGVTPFGLPPTIPLLVDGRVMDADWLVFGGGTRSAKVKTAPEALRRLPAMRVVEGLATPR